MSAGRNSELFRIIQKYLSAEKSPQIRYTLSNHKNPGHSAGAAIQEGKILVIRISRGSSMLNMQIIQG